MSEPFIALASPPASVEQPTYWFIFQAGQILVRREEGSAFVPEAIDVHELGLEPLRVQYLGLLGTRHCCSAECAVDVAPPPGFVWSGLRALFGQFDDVMFGLAGRAFQIMDWDRTHLFCGRCGTQTVPKQTERSRQCPSCGQSHYPRVAPAVIIGQRAARLRHALRIHRGPEKHKTIRIRVRQRPQQHRINDTEDRGIRAYAERERNDRDQTKHWITDHHPQPKAQIVN